MQRSLKNLAETEFDLLIIGGGAFGAAAAWDAALRGLSVALVEREDFGGGASAECFKMVHGGIRYLQHADLARLRSSCAERSAMLTIAPHLVKPLPIAIPTYGWGKQGKAFLAAGMSLYDLLSLDRNRGIRDAARQIGGTRFLSRANTMQLFPGLDAQALTGAAVFEDGQMYNPARLVLAFVKSAASRGAQVANYAEATGFLWNGNRVCGARVRDRLDDCECDVRAKLVLNGAGPGAEYLLQGNPKFGAWRRGVFSRDAYFIVDRPPTSAYALAIPGHSRDKDALLSRSARHMFAVPWRNRTLIGVWHRVVAGHPDSLGIDHAELDTWAAEINSVYPSLALRPEDVVFANFGLVPFGDPKSTSSELSFGKESRFIDHRRQHGIEGLVTLIGIRFTTARADAATALNLLLQQMPKPPAPAPTTHTALAGGDVESFDAMLAQLRATQGAGLSEATTLALAQNYGTEASALLSARDAADGERRTLGASHTLHAEITHAVAREMAQRLEDVILRRTDLGAAGHPGHGLIVTVATRMQQLLGWSDGRCQEEIASTQSNLARHHAIDRIVPEGDTVSVADMRGGPSKEACSK
ncbi:MAG: FAD-dependent oxidoreductase [Steroidobacteraceae bacterium]